jgi:hypothetical protein
LDFDWPYFKIGEIIDINGLKLTKIPPGKKHTPCHFLKGKVIN